MKGSMTNANHWVRVIEVAIKLRFLRAFGRAKGRQRVGGDPTGKGRRRGYGRVEEQVQKNCR